MTKDGTDPKIKGETNNFPPVALAGTQSEERRKDIPPKWTGINSGAQGYDYDPNERMKLHT